MFWALDMPNKFPRQSPQLSPTEDRVEGGEQADVSTLGEAQSASGEST